jgi:hypothetical protein
MVTGSGISLAGLDPLAPDRNGLNRGRTSYMIAGCFAPPTALPGRCHEDGDDDGGDREYDQPRGEQFIHGIDRAVWLAWTALLLDRRT